MAVVAIVGLPAAAVVTKVVGQEEAARIRKAKEDVFRFEVALTMFKLDNLKYPSTEQGLVALVRQPADPSIAHWRPGGYLEHFGKDPWGNDYHYENPGTHGKEFDVYTLGADGKPGGEGADADIGNWNFAD
jgi:general secretion pathway protein G